MEETAQFDIQTVVGTAETECLGPEVRGTLVEIWGHVE